MQIDTDGNGFISLGEILHLHNSNRSLTWQVCFLATALVLVLVGMFLVSLAASHLAQTTETANNALVAKGSPATIVQTADATQELPADLAPLLTTAQLGRVNELTLSKFTLYRDGTTNEACETCAEVMVVQVEAAAKHNQTFAKFLIQGGMEVTVDNGVVLAKGVPDGLTNETYTATAWATCDSVMIGGINVDALRQQAQALNHREPGGGRRSRGHAP